MCHNNNYYGGSAATVTKTETETKTKTLHDTVTVTYTKTETDTKTMTDVEFKTYTEFVPTTRIWTSTEIIDKVNAWYREDKYLHVECYRYSNSDGHGLHYQHSDLHPVGANDLRFRLCLH
jgi:hypothetical protein